MSNQFYREFDTELWGGERKEDYRSAFQVDRDRLIHSQAFRQLQSKTQVFLSGEYDFYRTRLTHSMEVAQIGRSICNYLRVNSPLLKNDFYIDESLIEAVCLAHDLGHSPFGHAGESSLHELMKKYGGFEGNAQTMRLLTEIFYVNEDGERGMTPTRALLDGVSKYKVLFGEFGRIPKNHFLYDEQKKYRDFLFGGAEIPESLAKGEALNKFKSIECQIMDWADDVAYSLNDIADGVQAGFVGMERIERWAEEISINEQWQKILNRLLEKMKRGRLESAFGARIGVFIAACSLRECENFMSEKTNRYRYELVVENEVQQEVEFFKRLATDLIFKSPQIQQMVEFKARKILSNLWDAYFENYVNNKGRSFNILPVHIGKLIDKEPTEKGKARRISDWLSGMTDGLAIKTYKRLNDADFGSIRDLS